MSEKPLTWKQDGVTYRASRHKISALIEPGAKGTPFADQVKWTLLKSGKVVDSGYARSAKSAQSIIEALRPKPPKPKVQEERDEVIPSARSNRKPAAGGLPAERSTRQ